MKHIEVFHMTRGSYLKLIMYQLICMLSGLFLNTHVRHPPIARVNVWEIGSGSMGSVFMRAIRIVEITIANLR